MRFPLKKFQGCILKAIPPAPHPCGSCDLWLESPSANYCLKKTQAWMKEENTASWLFRRKMSVLTVKPAFLTTRNQKWSKPPDDTSHFTQTPGWKCVWWPCENEGSSWCELISYDLSVQCLKGSYVELFLWTTVSQGQWMHPISFPPSLHLT